MKRDQHIACLRHLVIPAHTCWPAEALPLGVEELMRDLMLPGPAVAELIRAAGATGEDLGDAAFVRCQRLTQQLIVGECAWPGVAPW
jgi:hypothetical protein